ncbi:FMN reductase [Marinomonas sp. S3726]|uniref:NAD(P)H-dependent oxidoreductase n=1 Tax=Marinomonas sp. S3726 TaxID=579484 RepID=UPI0005FA537D|nr:NAD(P)H-dependent oxidoreductase [Marinomonas sp. S3726]KJZ08680.1 FMN reductase [Marinomonas sp. S3726]
MSKVLVISGHPNLEDSWTNKVILKQLSQKVESIEIRRLDQLYSDYKIDIEAEQNALLEADILILQFPFYWYSLPGLLKKWVDDVFAFNFAYGPEGNKLKDKPFILSFTVGGPKDSYDPLGYNHFTIEELIRPLQQVCYLSGMVYQDPIYTHQMVYIPNIYNTQEDVERRAKHHADRLIDKIGVLTGELSSKFKAFVHEWFKNFDELPEDNHYFLKHLSEKFELDAAGDIFKGKAGFNDWYKSLLGMFKPGVDHLIEEVTLAQIEDNLFESKISVRLIGELTNGESINALFHENWQVSVNSNDGFMIHRYQVLPS